MAKYFTIELRLDDAVDIYDNATHTGLLDAVKTLEAVLDARVVGVGEGPDPESEGDAAAPDDVATHHDPETGTIVPTEN